MKTADIFLLIGGAFNLFFALFHIGFWKLFKWKTELPKLSFINRGVMEVMNLCLIFLFLAGAFLMFFYRGELFATSLGSAVLIFWALFWFFRTIEQFVFFGFNRGSVAFGVIFAAGFFVFLVPALSTF